MNAPNDTKKVFKQCGTCSQTFAHLLNREFGYPKDAEIRALDPLADGILNTGHQCGMIWGTALALGAESYRRNKNMDQAIAVSVTAVQHVVESFQNRSNTISCREITGCDLNSVFGMVKFMLGITLKGMNNSKCFVLAEQWTPEAIQAANDSLDEAPIKLNEKPLSCASEVIKKMGGSEEEILMVSGFAGGLGLSGSACGALSAAIWMRTLQWCREHPGENPPYFKNVDAERILKAFKEKTKDEFDCSKITGQEFKNIDDHSHYLKNGGCKELIHTLANA